MQSPVAACEIVSREGVTLVLDQIRVAMNCADMGFRAALIGAFIEHWEAKAQLASEWLAGRETLPVPPDGEPIFSLAQINSVLAELDLLQRQTRAEIESFIEQWRNDHG